MAASAAVPASNAAAGAYGVSAGLDLLSGAFGYLSAQNAASAARSRGDLVRLEAEANAARYAEQAAQFEAHQKMMYLGSGVKVAGSPVDVLADSARVAHENIQAILAGGDIKALDEASLATGDEMEGRATLATSFDRAVGEGIKSYAAANGGSKNSGNEGVLAIAKMLGGG